MYTRIFRSRKYPRVFLISAVVRPGGSGRPARYFPAAARRNGRDVIAISAEIIARGTKAPGDKQGFGRRRLYLRRDR